MTMNWSISLMRIDDGFLGPCEKLGGGAGRQEVRTHVRPRGSLTGKPALLLFLVLLSMPVRATTRYVATNGSDSNSCTSNARCATINRAYQLSTNGDTVLMATGTYGGQSLSPNTGLSGSNKLMPDGTEVTINTESGPGTVTIDSVSFNGTGRFNITLQDLVITNGINTSNSGVSDIHVVGGHTGANNGSEGAYLGNNSSFISLQKTEMGPVHQDCSNSAKIIHLWGANNVLIEDSAIHDFTSQSGCGNHPDAIEICDSASGCPGGWGPVHDVTIRRNNFYNNTCDHMRLNTSAGSNLVVENNWFSGDTGFEGGCGYQFQIGVPGAVVRYNTIDGQIQTVTAAEGANQRWYGNVFVQKYNQGNCLTGTGLIAEYNVQLNSNPLNCGGNNNIQVSSFSGYFVNPAAHNYDLTASATAAIDPAHGQAFPSLDIHSASRGSAPDAGANEFGASQDLSPPSNLTAIVK
jgi:hypothetical protein